MVILIHNVLQHTSFACHFISNADDFFISLTQQDVGGSYWPNWYFKYLYQPRISTSVGPYLFSLLAVLASFSEAQHDEQTVNSPQNIHFSIKRHFVIIVELLNLSLYQSDDVSLQLCKTRSQPERSTAHLSLFQ